MADLAKALGRFLTRDIFYVLSGFYLLTTFLRVFDGGRFTAGLFNFDSDTAELIILLGAAYILGFVSKELFAFLRIIIEAHQFKPCWIEKSLYRLHQRKTWIQPEEFEHELVYAKISKAGAGSDVQSRYDRISDVIHTFSSVGTALTISGLILLFHNPVEALVGVLGLTLIAMSRFQALRRMRFLSKYREN